MNPEEQDIPSIFVGFRLDNGQEIQGEMDITGEPGEAWIAGVLIDTTKPIYQLIEIDDEA